MTASLTIGDNTAAIEAENLHRDLKIYDHEHNRILQELASGGPFGPRTHALIAASREAIIKLRDLTIGAHGLAQRFLWHGKPTSKGEFLQLVAHERYAYLSRYLDIYERASAGDPQAVTEGNAR